jgi:hypothetical protein
MHMQNHSSAVNFCLIVTYFYGFIWKMFMENFTPWAISHLHWYSILSSCFYSSTRTFICLLETVQLFIFPKNIITVLLSSIPNLLGLHSSREVLYLAELEHSLCSFGLSATSQQYFSLRTNQLSATSQQYFSLRANQHQQSATSQPNRLK